MRALVTRSFTSPGDFAVAGAGFFPQALVPDSSGARALSANPVDSLVDKTLLGDRITPVIQFLFQQAPWVMWGGAIIAAIVAAVLIRWLWLRRQPIRQWLVSRSGAVKATLAATVVLGLLATAGLGYKANEFVATDKRFCNGCHIFIGTGKAWVKPDSGDYTLVPMLEGKHDSLGCHTCHPLKPLKEGIKLIFWMSGFREEEIPEHAKVPRTICEDCHVQGRAEDKDRWKAIAATAGHRTHLESDSSALKGKIECLTCHAKIAHRFPPSDSTCGQSGCHDLNKTRIVLGRMKSQGDFHCVGCHEFTARVPALATRDSAASTLTPAMRSCFRCHAMQQRLPDFDERKDPHGGTCGMCHRPHTQTTTQETIKTCSTRECHGLWNQVPFHAGAQHRGKATQCTLCHAPHAARVDASDCVGCHQKVRDYAPGRRLFPPLPFDTSKALQESAAPEHPDPPERPSKVKGDAPPWDPSPERALSAIPSLPADTFSHPIHKKLACLTCHLSTSGNKLTFLPPRGCQICHHQRPEKADCKNCHKDSEHPEVNVVQVQVAAADKPARERSVWFRHSAHVEVRCLNCHGAEVTLAPVDSAVTCEGCHDKHHEAGRACATCHRTAEIKDAHRRPARIHKACDACHATAKVASLTPTRSFCLACHDETVDHNPDRECSVCHLQARPEDYRPRLLKAPTSR